MSFANESIDLLANGNMVNMLNKHDVVLFLK